MAHRHDFTHCVIRCASTTVRGALLLAALLLPLACDQPPQLATTQEAPPTPTPDPDAPVLIWHTLSESRAEVLHAELARFRQQHPELTLVVEAKPEDAAFDLFQQAVREGRPPDLFRIDMSWLPDLAQQGHLAVLDGVLDAEALADMVPAALDTARWQGQLYGLPASAEGLTLLYNRAMLKEKGESTPETMNDLSWVAATLARPDEGRYGFAMPLDGRHALAFIHAFGGALFDTRTGLPALRSDMVRHGLEFLLMLRDKHNAMPPMETGSEREAVSYFKTGQCAMLLARPHVVDDVMQGSAFQDARNLGMAPVPRGPGGVGPPIDGRHWVVSRHGHRVDAGMALARFLVEPERQVVFADKALLPPTRMSAYDLDPLAGRLDMRVIRQSLMSAHPSPHLLGARRLAQPLDDAVELLWRGALPLDAFAEHVEREWRGAGVGR